MTKKKISMLWELRHFFLISISVYLGENGISDGLYIPQKRGLNVCRFIIVVCLLFGM